jgi:hypothetical protein
MSVKRRTAVRKKKAAVTAAAFVIQLDLCAKIMKEREAV